MICDDELIKKLELYPEMRETLCIVESVDMFKYLLNMREKGVPIELYARYLRACLQMDTYNVSLELLEKAFEGITREMLMYDTEIKAFNELPDVITVYRGTDINEEVPRVAWSLVEERAKWFYHGKMFKAEIPKEWVRAYFKDNTPEEEIVLFLKSDYRVIY